MTQINIDTYLVDSLLPDLTGHDRRLSSFVVYLYLYRHATQEESWSVRMSHQTIASRTGLSRSAVQTALAHLQTRELISTTRPHPTAVPIHRVLRPWLRLKPKN